MYITNDLFGGGFLPSNHLCLYDTDNTGANLGGGGSDGFDGSQNGSSNTAGNGTGTTINVDAAGPLSMGMMEFSAADFNALASAGFGITAATAAALGNGPVAATFGAAMAAMTGMQQSTVATAVGHLGHDISTGWAAGVMANPGGPGVFEATAQEMASFGFAGGDGNSALTALTTTGAYGGASGSSYTVNIYYSERDGGGGTG